MPAHEQNLIWIDLEMTGLDPDADSILEIATLVTDSQLNVLAEGPELAIAHPLARLEAMDEWNRRTHGGSGLWSRVLASDVSMADAEDRQRGRQIRGPEAEQRVDREPEAGADERAEREVQELACAQHELRAAPMTRDLVLDLRAHVVLIARIELRDDRPQPVDDAGEAVVRGNQQRTGRRHQQGRREHGSQRAVVVEGIERAHGGGTGDGSGLKYDAASDPPASRACPPTSRT